MGFALSGRTPGQNELINGNRFIDVPYPVALDGKTPRNAGGLDVHFMPPSHLDAQTELPVPSQQHAGRMIVKGSSIYYCVNNGKEFLWMELSGKAVPQKKWRVIGPELVLNADQSGKDALPDSLKSPVHPGWIHKVFKGRRGGQLGMGLLVGAMDIATANNTVAIVMANPIAKEMSQEYGISSKRAACLLDTFSCIFQGVIPYGAQMLVAISAVAEMGMQVSAFNLMQYLFYPYFLLVTSLVSIFLIKERKAK